jgi:hypothetical protein
VECSTNEPYCLSLHGTPICSFRSLDLVCSNHNRVVSRMSLVFASAFVDFSDRRFRVVQKVQAKRDENRGCSMTKPKNAN